jgi:hypothetical protein
VSVSDRNSRVGELMNRLFDLAEATTPTLDRRMSAYLDAIFGTTSWGFREVVLLISLARLLDPKYAASKAFYSCNPRALYEGPMVAQLRSRRIPHRKSGPLNVAKATVGINGAWAAQRRPAHVAAAVVAVVEAIEQMDVGQLEQFAVVIHRRLLDEAHRIADLSIDIEPATDPAYLWNLCVRMIAEAPDGGNTPQRIIGQLLEAWNTDEETGLAVAGHEDRASVTSTTSKKPGDITEERAGGEIVRTYEVTIKRFDGQRITESYEAVKAEVARSGVVIPEVLVICRPEDAPAGVEAVSTANGCLLGSLTYCDLRYHFLDISKWIMGHLLRMSPDARRDFHAAFHVYVSEPNTAEAVKVLWAALLKKTGA